LYAIECCLFVALAAILHSTGVVPIVALAFADATLAFGARTMTRSAAASTLVPHGLMPEGKAAFNVALAGAIVCGPILGGVAIATLGSSTALLIDGCSFLLAGALIAREP